MSKKLQETINKTIENLFKSQIRYIIKNHNHYSKELKFVLITDKAQILCFYHDFEVIKAYKDDSDKLILDIDGHKQELNGVSEYRLYRINF